MGGHGHRHVYHATGLPGWVRFGYSPGWGGLPPAAQYLRDTGQLDAFLRPLPEQGESFGRPWGAPTTWSRDEQIAALSAQRAALQRSLDDVTQRIEALKKEGSQEGQ